MADFDTRRAQQKNRIRRRGIYLLPNLLTTAALFGGFYAIVQAMNQRFDQAAVGDLRRDGARRSRRPRRAPHQDTERVRRRVRQPSRHGELGAAPALVIYRVEPARHGTGWAGSPRSSMSPAPRWRLARFNTKHRRGRQALVHRLAEPRRGGDRRGLRLGESTITPSIRQPCGGWAWGVTFSPG
jgi:CDP-diacylglycerol--serine O-phosphatidyltransferase